MLSKKKNGYNFTENSYEEKPRSVLSGANIFTFAVLFLAIGYLLTDSFESAKDVSARTLLPEGEYANTFITNGSLRGSYNLTKFTGGRLSQNYIDGFGIKGEELPNNIIDFEVTRNKKQDRIKLASLGDNDKIKNYINKKTLAKTTITNKDNQKSKAKILIDSNNLIQKTKKDFLARERYCMAAAIYYEAAIEPVSGQKAVAQVVLNRKESKYYPNTICGVVFQNSEKMHACQFSFACDGKPDRVMRNKAWRKAEKIADDMMSGKTKSVLVSDASHYHADYVRPKWSFSLNAVAKIGRHIFYKSN